MIATYCGRSTLNINMKMINKNNSFSKIHLLSDRHSDQHSREDTRKPSRRHTLAPIEFRTSWCYLLWICARIKHKLFSKFFHVSLFLYWNFYSNEITRSHGYSEHSIFDSLLIIIRASNVSINLWLCVMWEV